MKSSTLTTSAPPPPPPPPSPRPPARVEVTSELQARELLASPTTDGLSILDALAFINSLTRLERTGSDAYTSLLRANLSNSNPLFKLQRFMRDDPKARAAVTVDVDLNQHIALNQQTEESGRLPRCIVTRDFVDSVIFVADHWFHLNGQCRLEDNTTMDSYIMGLVTLHKKLQV
jgi:hypothetical protein